MPQSRGISMATYDIARSVANRMRNAAEEMKIRIVEVNSWGSDTEVFASTSPHEISQWLCNNRAYGSPAMLDGGYYVQLPGNMVIFQGKTLDQWIDENRAGPASPVPAAEDEEKSASGVFEMGLPVYGERQSTRTTAITANNGQVQIDVLGTIRQGKSMLDRLGSLAATTQGKSMLGSLSDAQRQEFFRWMQDHPGTNGMAWPGWAETQAGVGDQADSN